MKSLLLLPAVLVAVSLPIAERLVELVAEKTRGSVTERICRRTGDSYALSSVVLGPLAVTPEQFQDRFSVAFQVALASRTIRELEELQRGAALAKKTLPTFAAETEVRFASPEARAAFAEELTAAVASFLGR
jgi:hypothetical protein